MSLQPLFEKLTRWVATRPDIVALAVVGSHARGDARPDSDVDLIMLCAAPAEFLHGDWPSRFGEVLSSSVENYGALKSLRVVYRNGLEVEFGIAEPGWARRPLDPGTRNVIADGMLILYDPRQLLKAAKLAVAAP